MKVNNALILVLLLLVGALLYQDNNTIIVNNIPDSGINIEEKKPYKRNKYLKSLDNFNGNRYINIPTRGLPEDYQAVGFLTETDTNNKQQLYGRQTYPNSDLWNYFVLSDDYHQIPIPLKHREKDCTDLRGCQEIYTNENINLNGKENSVTMYNLEPMFRL